MTDAVTLVIATKNTGKLIEIAALLKNYPVNLKSLSDFGPIPPVDEDGATFDDNAYKKAAFTARVLGLPALADDSGLVVPALGGEPGIHSARYGGDSLTDAQRCDLLLQNLKGKGPSGILFLRHIHCHAHRCGPDLRSPMRRTDCRICFRYQRVRI